MSFDERVLNGMSVLAAIARSGSFAGAAKALNMSQPGVSRSVARLEARLGLRLFERTTRSVALTDEGRRLYEMVIPLLDGLEAAASSVVEGRSTVRGRLRVNVHSFFSGLIPPAKMRVFLETFPELTVELITRDKLGDIVGEGFDLAIRFGDPRESTLIARKLLDTRILTVAAPSYLKRHGRPSHPSDLQSGDHTLIDFRNMETGLTFDWEFRRGKKTISITMAGKLIVTDVHTMHGMCIAGYGIAQIMELGSAVLFEKGQLIDLFPDWPDERFPLYVLYPSRIHMPAKTRVFLDFLSSIIQSYSTGTAVSK